MMNAALIAIRLVILAVAAFDLYLVTRAPIVSLLGGCVVAGGSAWLERRLIGGAMADRWGDGRGAGVSSGSLHVSNPRRQPMTLAELKEFTDQAIEISSTDSIVYFLFRGDDDEEQQVEIGEFAVRTQLSGEQKTEILLSE